MPEYYSSMYPEFYESEGAGGAEDPVPFGEFLRTLLFHNDTRRMRGRIAGISFPVYVDPSEQNRTLRGESKSVPNILGTF